MPIEVIQRGKKPAEIKYEVHCTLCTSILRYQAVDLKLEKTPLKLPFIKCPICGYTIYHTEGNRMDKQ